MPRERAIPPRLGNSDQSAKALLRLCQEITIDLRTYSVNSLLEGVLEFFLLNK